MAIGLNYAKIYNYKKIIRPVFPAALRGKGDPLKSTRKFFGVAGLVRQSLLEKELEFG
ncbi:MAG: hypothetical protein KAR05_11125 [Candidatus Omnitrophica bacterium]|nr:hypothetical protein [Candidatus Omnitrophota bacterium]